MELTEIKRQLQDHLSDGLVVVVGSGLSLAEGIPGMPALADHLKNKVPSRLHADSKQIWAGIENCLDAGEGLERALHKNIPDARLEELIAELTIELLMPLEEEIIRDVLTGKRSLRFERLLKHLLKPNSGIPVVTTNYDRLIEVAAEMSGLGVDTLFVGNHVGRFDRSESQYSLCREIIKRPKGIYLKYAEHVVVLKPHGSFDWFNVDGRLYRSFVQLDSQPLIITPGVNKYRNGYERPFDEHRDRANDALRKADRYLIVGYGFNDDHLQVHLVQQLKSGKPAVILTHSLTPEAKAMLQGCAGTIVVCADENSGGTQVITAESQAIFESTKFWDLGDFVEEVLEP